MWPLLPAPVAATFPPPSSYALGQVLQGGVALMQSNPGAVEQLAGAFADLSTSGGKAFEQFAAQTPAVANIAGGAAEILKSLKIEATPDALSQAAQDALDRASSVATYLGAILPDWKARMPLNWIAVTAEVDPPRRPVNIPSLPYPQYDMEVPLKAPSGKDIRVRARFAVISNNPKATERPSIRKGDAVLLFLHGDGSRLEEVSPLIGPLLAAGAGHGLSYTVVAVDLPSHGCTEMVDPMGSAFTGTPPWDNHAPIPPQRPARYPVLQLMEDFVVSFMVELDRQTGCLAQVLGPMGGSLGGNLCLRLARRTESWIRQSIAWSPASVWDSLASDTVKQAGPNHCSTMGHAAENASAREGFFDDVFEFSEFPVKPQPYYWFRNDWLPCKDTMTALARKDRSEVYNRCYRQWHYRMDWEQLLYSFNDPDAESSPKRYQTFRARLLLASGSEDTESPCTNIYSSCQQLGENLKSTAAIGRTFFIKHTGHSIHDERPKLLAGQIDAFTEETLGGRWQVVQASGAPLVRFTGSERDWQVLIEPPVADADKAVLQLTLSVGTGTDDLRNGSECDAEIVLKDLRQVRFNNINASTQWAGKSLHNVFLPLPAGTKAGDMTKLRLMTKFAGGLAGDNWNVDKVVLSAVV